MKHLVFLFFLIVTPCWFFGQKVDSAVVKLDSVKKDTAVSVPLDSLARAKDSIAKLTDSLAKRLKDSLAVVADSTKARYIRKVQRLKDFIAANAYLNTKSRAVAMGVKERKANSTDNVFYVVLVITFLLGFFRFFYARYADNLFRVFFNTSLRQSQLSDQLVQAKLPSLLFNILFILTGGVYIYLLLNYYNWVEGTNIWLMLLYCVAGLALIYFLKLTTLKFTGWITGYQDITDTYIFIIFLINKILGIVLLPLVVLIAFTASWISSAAIVISILLIGLMFFLRFVRSYGLLEYQLKVSKFHFLLYVVGIEVLPLLLIYKALVLLLSKNTITLQ